MKKLALVLVVVFALGITAASAASIVSEKVQIENVVEKDKKEKKSKSDSKCADKKATEGKKCCDSKAKKSCGGK